MVIGYVLSEDKRDGCTTPRTAWMYGEFNPVIIQYSIVYQLTAQTKGNCGNWSGGRMPQG